MLAGCDSEDWASWCADARMPSVGYFRVFLVMASVLCRESASESRRLDDRLGFPATSIQISKRVFTKESECLLVNPMHTNTSDRLTFFGLSDSLT